MPRQNLTPKRAKFVKEYLIDLNGTYAAIRAGYAQESADVEAIRLLGNASVAALLKQEQASLARRTEISQEQVVREVALLAFANMQDYTRWDDAQGTRVLDLSKCSRDQLAAVQELTEDKTGGSGDGERKVVLRTKLKLADKGKNLELLARMLGFIVDKTEHSGSITLVAQVEERLKAARLRE